MTLLASQIPILYCLMYFQSNRRSNWTHQPSSLLLDALTPLRRWPSSLSTRPHAAGDSNSKELFENKKFLPRRQHGRSATSSNVEDRLSWVRHQNLGPRQLCMDRYFDTSSQIRLNNRYTDIQRNSDCSRVRQEDVREMMSGRFMTANELQTILPEMTKANRERNSKHPTRYELEEELPYANLKATTETFCGTCNTDISYDVLTQVQDVKGVNHTVINFENAYQFIPAGRCVNENSPCGGGGNARCVQIYRAQWTLVWAGSSGRTSLVAHEVPSHCQCVNVGTLLGEGGRDKGPAVKKTLGPIQPETVSAKHASSTVH